VYNELWTVSVSLGDNGTFGRGQCVELLRTRYVHQFERCPAPAIAVTQEIKLPEPKD